MSGPEERDEVDGPRVVLPASPQRRYLPPRWHRVLIVLFAPAYLGLAIVGGNRTYFVLAGLWLLGAAHSWLVPSTVVDAHGFRTQHRLRRRTVAWTDVAKNPTLEPGITPKVKVRAWPTAG